MSQPPHYLNLMIDQPKPAPLRNGRFHNDPPAPHLDEGNSHLKMLGKFLSPRNKNAVPAGGIPVVPVLPAELEARRNVSETHLYRLGHSTILMKFGADYWLTDPVFSNRASPVRWAGPKRFHAAPMTVDDLPTLKGVILSHNHYDHLDKPTIKRLAHKVERFITPLGLGKYLQNWGVPASKITELDWWQSHGHGSLNITATPSQHFSGRGLRDTNKSLWASFVLRHKGARIFFGSDSGYFDGFAKIGAAHGPFDLTLLECGAYDDLWPHMHMTPPQMMQAFHDLGGGTLMPIHNGTFRLAFHTWKNPLERISELADSHGTPLLTPHFGECVTLGAPVQPNPWWEGLR